MRRGALFAGLMLLAACAGPSVGVVDGPLLVSPPGASDGMGAEVRGRVVLDDATGCLLLDLEGVRYPVVWPDGTGWEPDPPAVRLPEGQRVTPGRAVSAGGGYLDRAAVEAMAGAEVAAEADRCTGPSGEVAVFNPGSEVTVAGQ